MRATAARTTIGLISVVITTLFNHHSVASADCTPDSRARFARGAPIPPSLTTDTDVVHLRIDGRDFFVPRNFFRYPTIGCGAEESSMLLRVLPPDLMPYSESTKADFENSGGGPRWMNIYIQKIIASVTIRDLIQVYTSGRSHKEQHHPGLDLTVIPAWPNGNAYVHGNGEITTVIGCDYLPIHPSFNRPFPMCTHHFDYKGFRVRADYGMPYLSEWTKIESSTRALLDRFMSQ
jgi:hypothetical protein